MSELKNREPLSREEVIALLNQKVAEEEKHWGKDHIYSKWAREYRDQKIDLYDAGTAIPVFTCSYVESYGNGCGDFSDTLYSDGSVETTCYGYLD